MGRKTIHPAKKPLLKYSYDHRLFPHPIKNYLGGVSETLRCNFPHTSPPSSSWVIDVVHLCQLLRMGWRCHLHPWLCQFPSVPCFPIPGSVSPGGVSQDGGTSVPHEAIVGDTHTKWLQEGVWL